MTLIVDASIAVKWLVEEPDRLAARSLLDGNEHLQAPDFVFVEAANVLWKKVLRRELAPKQAPDGIDSLPRLFESIIPSALVIGRALHIAIEIAHPVYDCLYLACAEHANADLVTADARFVARLRTSAPGARAYSLSDFAGPLR
jgi:predicted nucleic acid-binding protein